MPTTNLPQYGTCRKCSCSIINHGKGWYHVGERNTSVQAPGHFAEPMMRAVA